jgi:hypothetical protein
MFPPFNLKKKRYLVSPGLSRQGYYRIEEEDDDNFGEVA